MILRKLFALLGFLLVTLFVSSARAHLMPAGKGTLNVIDSKVYVVVSLPVSAFYEGSLAKQKISKIELKQDESMLRERVRRGIHLVSNGETAVFDQILLSLPSGEGHDGTGDEDLLLMIVARFTSPPSSLTLASDLWAKGKGGLVIKATVSEGRNTLKSEMGELSLQHSDYEFFSTPGAMVASSFGAGKLPIFAAVALLLLALLLFLRTARRRNGHRQTILDGPPQIDTVGLK